MGQVVAVLSQPGSSAGPIEEVLPPGPGGAAAQDVPSGVPVLSALAVAAMPHASKPAESPGLRALDSAPPGLLPSWSPTPLALLREGVFPRFQG